MSTSTTSASPKELQVRTNRAAFWALAASSTPPRWRGWLAMKPTGRPSMRPMEVTTLRANRGAISIVPGASARPAITLAHVIDLARGARDDRADVGDRRILGGHGQGGLAGVLRQVIEQIAREVHRVDVVAGLEVGDAVAGVNGGASKVVHADVLSHHLAHDARTRQEEPGLARHHDEVRERRGVGAPARRDACDDGDLRARSRHPDLLAEDAAIPGKRRDPLVHPRPRRLDEADHGRAGRPGHSQHPHDRLAVRRAERATGETAVLGVGEDGLPAAGAGGGDHPIPGLAATAPAGNVGPEDVHRPGVAEMQDPLQRR